jgi:hypothetical protein
MQHRNAAVRSDTRAMKIDKPEVRPTAGVTLKAVEALRDPNVQHFTREQVAYLMHLAFLSGAEHRRAFDLAELIATWDANTNPRQTREQRIAFEMQRYADQAEMRRLRTSGRRTRRSVRAVQPTGLDESGNVVPVGEMPNPRCEWPDVAQPGQPDRLVAA